MLHCIDAAHRYQFSIRDKYLMYTFNVVTVKGQAIPALGHGGPESYDSTRFLHFLDNRLTDGGEVVSLTLQPPLTTRRIPGTHFL
jgi:hypothetical protein